MTFRDRMKVFKRTMARNGLHSSTWVLNHLPYPVVKAMTYFLIFMGFLFAVKQKRLTQESLSIAFANEKTKREQDEIFRACFSNLGKGMVELIYFMGHPPMITAQTFFDGKEHLEQAIKGGKGVIAVSAHFGNFPLMLLRLAQEGYDTHAIIRPTRDKKIEEYFLKLRSRLGLHTVYAQPRKPCVDESLKVLRQNGILFIPLDQNFGNGAGVFVDFFGQKAATATGPVVFAMRTGAPILPIFTVRQKDDRHKIIIHPPFYLEEGRDDKETIFINTSRITSIIENYIRRYPAEWGWMHRRWKSRPEGEPSMDSIA